VYSFTAPNRIDLDSFPNLQLSQKYDSDKHHVFPENVEEIIRPLYTIFKAKTFKNLSFYSMKKSKKDRKSLKNSQMAPNLLYL
jgi:hypothetical protein